MAVTGVLPEGVPEEENATLYSPRWCDMVDLVLPITRLETVSEEHDANTLSDPKYLTSDTQLEWTFHLIDRQTCLFHRLRHTNTIPVHVYSCNWLSTNKSSNTVILSHDFTQKNNYTYLSITYVGIPFFRGPNFQNLSKYNT